MRNLFDQYTQPENRLNHALACCLHDDTRPLGRFLKWVRAPAGSTSPEGPFSAE